jgi:hypothetical protein
LIKKSLKITCKKFLKQAKTTYYGTAPSAVPAKSVPRQCTNPPVAPTKHGATPPFWSFAVMFPKNFDKIMAGV